MKPYAILARESDLEQIPEQYQHLLKKIIPDQMAGILRIVTVDRQTIFLYSLLDKKVYNPLTLQELSQPD